MGWAGWTGWDAQTGGQRRELPTRTPSPSHPPALPASQEEDEEEDGEGEGEDEEEEEGEGEGLEEVSGEVVASGGRGGAAGWARSDRTDDPNDVSLFIFTASNPIRAACKGLAENKHFDAFIIFLIIFSSGCLALDAPRPTLVSQWSGGLFADEPPSREAAWRSPRDASAAGAAPSTWDRAVTFAADALSPR